MSKILITSALPYINGVKHLGNLVGSLLPADVHARFRRQVGDEVLFICGTDEHGTPAELGAIEAGANVQHYCDRGRRGHGTTAMRSMPSRPTSIGASACRLIISAARPAGRTTH